MGPVFALARIQENTFEELFFRMLAKFLGEFMSVRIHAAPVFASARIQARIPGDYLCIGFVPGGIS